MESFLDGLAAATPTPGGGGAAAMAAAMGSALIKMVAGLTHARRKYADVKEEVGEIIAKAEKLRAELIQLVEDDAYVYERVITVLQHRTDRNDKTVIKAIEDALIGAAQVPLNVAQLSLEVAQLGERLASIGLAHAAADAAAACQVAEAAAHISRLNILTNLREVENDKLKTSWQNKSKRIVDEVSAIAARTRLKVEEGLLAPPSPPKRRRRRS